MATRTITTNSGDIERTPVWKSDGYYIRIKGEMVRIYRNPENDRWYTQDYEPVAPAVESPVVEVPATKTATKKEQQLKECTMLIENQERDVIQCTTNKAFGFVAKGEQIWLVRSSADASRYYIVHELPNGGYECSCPQCQQRYGSSCKHTKIISEQVRIANLPVSELKKEVFAFIMQFSTPLDKLKNVSSEEVAKVKAFLFEKEQREKDQREFLLSLKTKSRGGYLPAA